ncbi:MAG: nitrite/sulfite reductase [Luminiphilus sp.]|nr:nitrite/sulfite reductase [Luminiphilus sp.]
MYKYNPIDQAIVDARVSQFSEQMTRYLAGELPEEQFMPLRLQNGLYIQKHAPMLRVAIPYGTLAGYQLRHLAQIARQYDRGYGHFTTRQNIQFNWLALEQVPEVLGELATVQMHAIQTSGACVRNTTTDPLAGTVPDEAIDPRVVCELIRQWSTFHPEFAYLPRKFKIAVVATEEDRAAIEVHDVGIRVKTHAIHGLAFDLWVGGGLGRTPLLGHRLLADLPLDELRNWLTAVLRVYNLAGRRDNKYKARIKILVNAMGVDSFREAVTHRYLNDHDNELKISPEALKDLSDSFSCDLKPHPIDGHQGSPEFQRWYVQNTKPHRIMGYRSVFISLKRPGTAPGDVTAQQMDVIADLADRFSHSEIRTTHDQNLILPHVAESDLNELLQSLTAHDLAHPNLGLISDSIACPGLDFCSLANAPSLSLAEALHETFDDLDEQVDIGPLEVKISGCMNACGHHHIAHIGILGVEKKGQPWYQITLGGRDQQGASLGKRLGPAVPHDDVLPLIKRLINTYLSERQQGEYFVGFVDRIGVDYLKEISYATH